MLKVNGIRVCEETGLAKHFPDGTQLLTAVNMQKCYDVTAYAPKSPQPYEIRFRWEYERDEELVTLIFLSKHYRDKLPNSPQYLVMNYCPNARMDRTKNFDEVFTLKYFCQVINSLGFEKVTVFDPHSNVTPALLDRVEVVDPKGLIVSAIGGANLGFDDYVYFPDEGAAKRYGDIFSSKRNVLIGHKKRDWLTGKILGLEITGAEGQTFEDGHFQGCRVIMIDDIISYGGTLAYSADELKKLGFKHIYAYASHTENSVLDEEKGTFLKRLNEGTVDRLFTTDSIYTGQHDKITVLNIPLNA